MAGVECKAQRLELAGKYGVNVSTGRTQNTLELPVTADVSDGPSHMRLDHFLKSRYVILRKSVTQPCTIVQGPLQQLDHYLLQWSQNFVPGPRQLNAAAAVEIYLSDTRSQLDPHEPHLIVTPKKCETHFTELAKKFGGKLDSKRFMGDLRESIAAALAEEIKDQSSHPTSPEDKIRLIRAENLAKAWFKPSDPIRQQLTDFLDKLDK